MPRNMLSGYQLEQLLRKTVSKLPTSSGALVFTRAYKAIHDALLRWSAFSPHGNSCADEWSKAGPTPNPTRAGLFGDDHSPLRLCCQPPPRLKSELAVFDLGFFEEVEDLKYSYSKLKREAEKLAKPKVKNVSSKVVSL